jgi:hypothetical protein
MVVIDSVSEGKEKETMRWTRGDGTLGREILAMLESGAY